MPAKEADAIRLRQEGKSYKEIWHLLNLPAAKAWQLANRERHNENCRESNRRYYARAKLRFATWRALRRSENRIR